MDKIEINKRIDYILSKLETLKLAIEDYKTSQNPKFSEGLGVSDSLKKNQKFEKYKSLKTIERDCEEIIESAVRINQEILQEEGTIGNTYRETFEILKEFDEFEDKVFLEKLANSCGFRNRLAHDYINLDEKITVKSAENILKIYPKYLLNIKNLIKKF